jgi:hypothetical protein
MSEYTRSLNFGDIESDTTFGRQERYDTEYVDRRRQRLSGAPVGPISARFTITANFQLADLCLRRASSM